MASAGESGAGAYGRRRPERRQRAFSAPHHPGLDIVQGNRPELVCYYQNATGGWIGNAFGPGLVSGWAAAAMAQRRTASCGRSRVPAAITAPRCLMRKDRPRSAPSAIRSARRLCRCGVRSTSRPPLRTGSACRRRGTRPGAQCWKPFCASDADDPNPGNRHHPAVVDDYFANMVLRPRRVRSRAAGRGDVDSYHHPSWRQRHATCTDDRCPRRSRLGNVQRAATAAACVFRAAHRSAAVARACAARLRDGVACAGCGSARAALR